MPRIHPIAIVILASITAGRPVAAQDSAPTGGLEEIIVTAQKREQRLQDVGISVSAFSGEQIEQLGYTSTVDIVQQVPGMQLTAWTPAFTIFSLRGISQNSFQDNLEAPVAVYIDGAYVASMNAINTQLFDMERVEVLRGPQGTLFGRNATGGLIQYITRKATEQELNGYVEASAADFGSYSFEGAIGGGFSDTVRGRFAGRWERSDGYLEAGEAFGVPATGQTSMGADGYALRGNLQIDASEDVLIGLTGYYAKDDEVPSGQYVVSLAGFDINTGLGSFEDAYLLDPVSGAPVGPMDFDRTPITGDVHEHWSNEDTFFNRETSAITARVEAALTDDVQLVSITNWLTLDKFYIEDAGGGFGFFPYNTVSSYDQWSEELRLSGGSEPWRWQVGAYYLDMTWDTFQSVAGALILGGTSNTQSMSTFGKIDSSNKSIFGQVEYDISSDWTAILGLRWSEDDKEIQLRRVFEDVPQGTPASEVFNIDDAGIPGLDTIDYGDYAARAQLNWTPAEDILTYLSFNRGIKGGNWSLDPLGAVAPQNLKHTEEVLKAYEIGFKSTLFDGIAQLNTAAFYYDYDDYQAFSLVGLTPQVTNSDATASGGEIELELLPMDELYLRFGAAFLESEVEAVPDVFGGTVQAEFPLAPAVSLNWLARYEWSVFDGSLAAQVDGVWNDDQYLEGTNSNVSFEPGYSVWNARLSYLTGNERVRLSVWAKNVMDEEYRLYNLDLGLLGFVEQAFGPPRQIGVSASYSW